ncbi:MAG: hypothetical protein ONB44_13955 [candidate division KSB1 bacterium]|nr:hypothetical protein [candidate division KSB1 bacterium]
MSLEEVLALVTTKLEQCDIPYMIVGSFASNMYGIPRATQDADVIVEISAMGINHFSRVLGDEFYFDVEEAKEALKLGMMFNAVHYETGFKIDLIVRKNRRFSQEEFQRRKLANFAGRRCWFATAEDTILAKLEWSKIGESERQFNDAVNIAKVQGENLDRDYLRRWAGDLQVEDLLNRLLQEITPTS